MFSYSYYGILLRKKWCTLNFFNSFTEQNEYKVLRICWKWKIRTSMISYKYKIKKDYNKLDRISKINPLSWHLVLSSYPLKISSHVIANRVTYLWCLWALPYQSPAFCFLQFVKFESALKWTAMWDLFLQFFKPWRRYWSTSFSLAQSWGQLNPNPTEFRNLQFRRYRIKL